MHILNINITYWQLICPESDRSLKAPDRPSLNESLYPNIYPFRELIINSTNSTILN